MDGRPQKCQNILHAQLACWKMASASCRQTTVKSVVAYCSYEGTVNNQHRFYPFSRHGGALSMILEVTVVRTWKVSNLHNSALDGFVFPGCLPTNLETQVPALEQYLKPQAVLPSF